MEKEQFSKLVLERDYEKVQAALQEGFDPNTPLENERAALEWCSFTDDYRMMEILWKAGATPTTPYIQTIVTQFQEGKTYAAFQRPSESLEDYPDRTEQFSVNLLHCLPGTVRKAGDTYSIQIPIKKFVLDEEIVDTQIALEGIELPHPFYEFVGSSFTFPVNPEPGYIDGSIYLRHAHNPVDIRRIAIISLDERGVALEMDMEFLFEFEDIGFPNERMTKTVHVQESVNET